MKISSWILLALILFSFSFFCYRAWRLIRYLRLGKPVPHLGDWKARINTTLLNVLAQARLFKEIKAGLMHFLIFWGFIVITIGTTEILIQGIIPSFSFAFIGDRLYKWLLLKQDLFNLFVSLAILYALYRRLISHPDRMSGLPKSSHRDALLILSLILSLMVTNILSSAASQLHEEVFHSWQPVAMGTAHILKILGITSQRALILHQIAWWSHILIVLGFLCYLPFSKHLHIMASTFNVFFTSFVPSRPKGALTKLSFEQEGVEFGVSKLEDFTWKQLLDEYSCTECGRCNVYCPTASTGKPLRPKELIVKLRRHLMEKGNVLLSEATQQTEEGKAILSQSLIGHVITEEEIWDCTTCGACVEACPVFIEHVDKIVDMRRHLVMMEGKMDPEAQTTFRNWETHSNPWGLGFSGRGDWAKDLSVKRFQDKPHPEYLFYVGCAGSFDSRNKKVSQAMVKILNAAGISFGILGGQEKCNGEAARRLGNEYLGQQMAQENLGVLQKYNVKKIITQCPHCFNTLKNEYPMLGGNFEVITHAELIQELIASGKIQLPHEIKSKIVYHDACYLGRYNKIYNPPREVVKSLKGVTTTEMHRCRDKGFCCGAGGGRMWVEEVRGTRINENRVEEAAALNPNVIATACPYCLIQIGDGVKTKNLDGKIQTKDIAELVAEAMA